MQSPQFCGQDSKEGGEIEQISETRWCWATHGTTRLDVDAFQEPLQGVDAIAALLSPVLKPQTAYLAPRRVALQVHLPG